MKYQKLKLILNFESSFITPLQSDTLFGEFCWAFLYMFGKNRLRNLLSEPPGIVFSDGIPNGYLPIPFFPMKNVSILRGRSDEEAQKLYKDLKDFKKRKFVSRELFEKKAACGEKLTEELFGEFRKLRREGREKEKFLTGFAKKQESIHVSIDRRSGKAREGMLFQSEEIFPEKDIAVYVLYRPEVISKEEIEETFKFIGVSGFGAKKSWGKGKFSFKTEEFDLKEGNSNFFVSLSTGLPKEDEIEKFYAEFFTKFPKHGREFGRKEVFKNPLILSRPGAVYYPLEKKEVYGSFVQLSVDSEHYHSTFIVPLFIGE